MKKATRGHDPFVASLYKVSKEIPHRVVSISVACQLVDRILRGVIYNSDSS